MVAFTTLKELAKDAVDQVTPKTLETVSEESATVESVRLSKIVITAFAKIATLFIIIIIHKNLPKYLIGSKTTMAAAGIEISKISVDVNEAKALKMYFLDDYIQKYPIGHIIGALISINTSCL